MSTFNNNALTVQGMVAIAALVAGGTLEFTRIAVGDGELKDGQVPGTMTKLNNPLFDVTINKVYSDSVSQATIQGVFSNSQVATGFYYRELGLFAKDPATGSEILYAYGNAGEDAEWITPAGESSIIEKEIHIVVLIGNATNVTATLNSGIYAIKKETEAALALKADLDNTAEEGGRVLATQMRFDADQTLYVDAAAAEGGDGSQAKPFKTIQAAINARYKGAPVIYIRIKAGTYTENISVPRSPGTTWRFIREGTGTVAINTAIIDNCTYILFDNLTFNGPATDNSTIIYVANTASANFNAVTVNGASNATSINFSTSRGIIRNSIFNNSGLAIAATDGAYLDLKGNSGTGNIRALQADGSIIISDWYIPQATTPYEKVNGGVINLEGGTSSFPSNYSQMYNLGDFTDAGTLKTAILTEFRKLGIGESRDCWFANNISAGFGPFGSGQRMQCKIIKSTDSGSGYGTIIFYSHHNAPAGYMQVQDGAFATAAPVKFITGSDVATYDTYGLVRVADDTDVLSDDNDEAAITPAVYHDVSDFRHKSTAYKVGDKVECMFNFELFLECTQGGTTGSGALDTRNVTHGQVITDGTVKWTVRTHIKSVNNIVADASGNVIINTVTNATKATQDSDGNTINTTYLKKFSGEITNFNITKEGIYYWASSSTLSNHASEMQSNPGVLCVFADTESPARLMQIATIVNKNIIYTRSYVNGSWSTWNKIAHITDNVASATKATQDGDGKAINTTYLKRSGGTMTGALNLASNVFNLAGDDCYFGDQNVAGGFCLKGANGTTNLTFINKDDTTKKASLSYAGGNLISSATIQGNLSGTASKATNADNATKATQDSSGQQINTTYVKGVTVSNATLTVTKGNGTTSSITVNNVSRAEYSDRVGANAGYSNDTKGSGLKGGLSQSAIYNNGFPFAYGNLISVKNSGANQIALEWSGTTGAVGRVAVRSARDAGIDTWSAWRYLAYTESPAFSGTPTAPTPGTTDNGTRIATTGFVHSLLGQRGNTTASKATNGYWKDNNTGIIRQWGYISQGNYTSKSHNFPISFPNKCFTVLAICAGNVGTGATKNAISTNILNNSQFQLSIGEFSAVYWEAIGY